MLGNKYLLGKKAWLGKKHSEETKAVIKEKRKLQVMPKGYKRKEFSEEWKRNMSLSQVGKKNHKYKDGKRSRGSKYKISLNNQQ